MKIGFYGALANNTYAASKSFINQGLSVVYIKDICDNFPFSQPVWEDVEFVLDYDLIDSAKWDACLWEKKEKDVGWISPEFVKSAYDFSDHKSKIKNSILEKILLRALFCRNVHRKAVINSMRHADVWIVCGVEAAILARASGKPYVIWPHGGDIRFAAGIGCSVKNYFGRSVLSEATRFLLQKSYKKCLFIGSSDPDGLGGHVGHVAYDIEYFPFPMPYKNKILDRKVREEKLIDLFCHYGVTLPKDKIYAFIPSRIDFYWKGTDRLIAAIKSTNIRNIHFIFSGWGRDYQMAKAQLAGHDVTFLPFAMSKAFLFKVYDKVDFVVDQFLLGSYGTSALESMSVGTPVIMHIDCLSIVKKGWLPPPVINVQTSNEIANVLQQIDQGHFPLNDYSAKIVEWFRKTHEESVSVPMILNKIIQALKKIQNE